MPFYYHTPQFSAEHCHGNDCYHFCYYPSTFFKKVSEISCQPTSNNFQTPSFIIPISKTTIIKVIGSPDRFRQSHNYYCKNPPYTQQTKNSVFFFSLFLFLLTDKIIHELSRPPARTLQNLERKNHH